MASLLVEWLACVFENAGKLFLLLNCSYASNAEKKSWNFAEMLEVPED